MRVLILEDNRDRRIAMMGRLVNRFPFLRVEFFEASSCMIQFMESENLDDVALISLDHDLELIAGIPGQWTDPGTGLDVAQWLSKLPEPLCPVIVQTTNSSAGDNMMYTLEQAQWNAFRVFPHDDLEWVNTCWFPVVRNAIVKFAPKAQPIPGKEDRLFSP